MHVHHAQGLHAVLIVQNDFQWHAANGGSDGREMQGRKYREQTGRSQKAKAPSIARGFEILNDVRQTLTMINGAVELSGNFGVERPEEGKGVEPY